MCELVRSTDGKAPPPPPMTPYSEESGVDQVVLVYPRVTVIGVNDVKLIEQSFDCELQLELTWRDAPFIEEMKTEKWRAGENEHGRVAHLKATYKWNPKTVLNNVFMSHGDEPPQAEWWYRVDADATELISLVARFQGSFRERFELQHFPFDCQWLTVRLTSAHEYVRFAGEWPFGVSVAARPDFIQRHAFILEQWDCAPVICMQGRLTDREVSLTGVQYHELNIKLLLRRQPEYYLWNIVFIDFALVLTALTVLLVPPTDFADRMSLSLTLLLTAVAFKQVVSTHLPEISYSTLLDRYVLYGFAFQVLVVMQNALAKFLLNQSYSHAENEELAGYIADYWGGIVLLTVLCGYQAYFVREALRLSNKTPLRSFIQGARPGGFPKWQRTTTAKENELAEWVAEWTSVDHSHVIMPSSPPRRSAADKLGYQKLLENEGGASSPAPAGAAAPALTLTA